MEKLKQADFIEEAIYPMWLANVVLVRKANGQWKVCINFTNLNKSYPKEKFPLPLVEQLVDST